MDSSNVMFDQRLTNAACEWFLIILMFIDALLSYLLVWFARYCKLQMPCFLCSKLLHHHPPIHWRLLLCTNHRTEVSCYMSCYNHNNNLVDCRGMCDDCLLSFTKFTTPPNQDMNRLLLGKLGYDLLCKSNSSACLRLCSCCNKPWRSRQHTQRVIRLGSSRSVGKPKNIPSAPRYHLTRRGSSGSLKKMRDHKVATRSKAHEGYKELKIHSESESEFLFSDDESFLPITNFNVEPSEESIHKLDKKMSDHEQSDWQENRNRNIHVEDNHVDETKKKKAVEAEDREAVLSELIAMSEARPFSLGVLSELITMSETRPFSLGGVLSELKTMSKTRPLSLGMISELISMSEARPFSLCLPHDDAGVSDKVNGSGTVPSEPSKDDDNEGEGGSKSFKSNDMPKEQSSEEDNEVDENNVAEEYFSNQEEDEVNVQSSKEEDVDNGESEHFTSNNVTCSSATEKHSGETESLKSPTILAEEESLLEHSSKATETTEHKHSASVESFVSISSDIEGESLVDMLKQQLEHEKKRLRDLNKELEEERNASAVAINEAMAMITRLQEEKASLHMEALQYLRMMDEQAEHDVGALERANDVLAEKEKEIQDLEMELEYYRVKYPDEPREEILASMGILENVDETNNPKDNVPSPGA